MHPEDPYRAAPPKHHIPIERPYAEEEQLMLAMKRGRFDANAYVFFGAVFQVVFVGALVALPAVTIFEALGVQGETSLGLFLGALAGVPAAIATYWGRWSRTEAFASRFCSGVANLSLLYVPIIAFVYANVLLGQDLLRKR